MPAEYMNILYNPLYIAAFAITVAAALVLAAVQCLLTCLRRSGGPSSTSRFFGMLRMRGRHRTPTSKRQDVSEGSEELLMDHDKG